MFRSLASWFMDDLESSVSRTEFRRSLYKLASLGTAEDKIRPIICPMSSPCSIDRFRPFYLRTMVSGPVTAAVTDLASPNPIAARIMDPSDAHVRPLCGSFDG